MFGPAYEETADRLGSLARSTVECLGRSDALYHNMEHTLLVTLVGRDILQGLSLSHRIEPDDYSHLVCACLLHDIGYVRGILSGDSESEFVINQEQVKITLPRGASDAALTPYHVDRSKIFALERLGTSPLVDAVRVAKAIELTRFPASVDQSVEAVGLEPKLVQAADLIGQLGDPMYPKKANALYYEFEETGMNRQLGIFIAGGSDRQIPPLLLELHFNAYRGRPEAPESDRVWPAMDRKLASSCPLRRAFGPNDGPTALGNSLQTLIWYRTLGCTSPTFSREHAKVRTAAIPA